MNADTIFSSAFIGVHLRLNNLFLVLLASLALIKEVYSFSVISVVKSSRT